MSLIEADELIRRIKADFPLEPLPLLAYGEGSENYFANQLFKGKTWMELTTGYLHKENIDNRYDAGAILFFITDEAFRYYTPAYINMFFGSDYEESRWLFEHLIDRLSAYNPFSPRNNKEIYPSRIECFSGFTENQKRDIADFLYHQTYFEGRNLYLNGTYNQWAKSAFDSYWHQFASQEAA